MAYDRLSPIGSERLDVLAALIRYEIALPWSRQRLQPADFLVQWDAAIRQKDPKILSAMIMQWGRMQGRSKRKGRRNGLDDS